jgi:protein-tyrosine-phosphatase
MGIDISHQRAKLVEAIDLEKVDLAINLSSGDLAKRLPPKLHRLQWPMPDPAVADPKMSMGAHFEKFQRACVELQARIGELRDRYVSLD